MDVTQRLLELSGGDPFARVRERSVAHQRDHGCGLHAAGGPVMQLACSYVRVARARRILDLGCGLGYSTLWLAAAAGDGADVVGIDSDPTHVALAREITEEAGLADRVTYETGRVVDVLERIDGQVDAVHDDAWFARRPDHLDAVIGLLRPGGLLTMPNWFLLVDALTGEPRNDWERFAGPTWADDSLAYAQLLADHADLESSWVTSPPLGVATKTP